MITMSSHTGTHIDAPRHFVEGGATVENLCLETLNGEVFVASVTDVETISAKELELAGLPEGVERLLLKTSNSDLWSLGCGTFQKNFVALTLDGAEWLIRRGVKLVGIDYLSIQRFHDSNETHRVLLGNGVIVVEGLNLAYVEAGSYELLCLPLPIVGAEGAPARVVLRCLT